MKHEFIGKPVFIGTSLWEITIRLVPANETETIAIRNLEVNRATVAERELINNYLLFGIAGWSVLSIKSQNAATFKLKATEV